MFIKSTVDNPSIFVDFDLGLINIDGISTPQDAFIFYQPLLVTLDYINECSNDISIKINLDYADTESIVYLKKMLVKLSALQNQGMVIKINWYWANHEMKDLGEMLKLVSHVPLYVNYVDLLNNAG